LGVLLCFGSGRGGFLFFFWVGFMSKLKIFLMVILSPVPQVIFVTVILLVIVLVCKAFSII
jgi:hypothetical protein